MNNSSNKNLVIYNRVLESANYIIEHGATIRQTAEITNVGKSTTHLDLTVRLKELSPFLYNEVEKILQKNLEESHIRGGEATKQKILSKKNIK